MRHIKLFEDYSSTTPDTQILLDGTSSSGKSAALKGIGPNWCVLPVDSFYNVMYEEQGVEDFGNSGKPTISEIYPNCPYGQPDRDSPDWELAARWYMAQEVLHGKIFKEGLRDARGETFGRGPAQRKIVYDDVQGAILDACKESELPRPKWILIHAPMDHLLLNIERRKGTDGRDPKGVFIGAYCFKYTAKPKPGGVDPTHPWTRESVRKLLQDYPWAEEFMDKLGIKGEGKYWIYAKPQPEGGYDVTINTRNGSGGQKSIEEIARETRDQF
jgi:hypothetical protein